MKCFCFVLDIIYYLEITIIKSICVVFYSKISTVKTLKTFLFFFKSVFYDFQVQALMKMFPSLFNIKIAMTLRVWCFRKIINNGMTCCKRDA